MKKFYFLFSALFITSLSFGQLVINEIDADSPGTDAAEFIELKWTPNTSLDGFVVVLFNGSDDLSYDAFDLDGYSTDANGFFILANTALISPGDYDIPPGGSGAIQNGADAIAIYQDDGSNWPNDTAITLTNLIDVIVYDTNDSDDAGLLSGFSVSTQYNEGANGNKDGHSLQRQGDGTFEALSPTFRADNATPSGPVQVANIAALKTDVDANGAGGSYELQSTPTITYTRVSRNQKYIQDATGGILIDDASGTITTSFSVGDGMSGLVGTASIYNGILQFVPTQDASVAAGSTITPEVVTIANLLANVDDYESKLVRINTVSFTEAGGTFATGTDYTINDASSRGGSSMTFRTSFSEADYIGQTIPSGNVNMEVLVGEFNGTPQVTGIDMAGITLSTKENQIDGFELYPNPTSSAFVNIFSDKRTPMKVSVFDILGKQVIQKTITNNRLNVSNLTTGVYILRAEQDHAFTTRKLVIN
ncbi:DUF5689 domain-containing protein [Pontimicrobium aquaticum]|uniref:T9SS type A sorting domain-containing protein n=1 Tax=Pontimicrobium aquaticum TaxID=2565367 RepID=A0A4U0F0R7_9FLAO|nr:DUF5689 domain-containing protein [Pontimicrobium aquaticum]TJY37966.1 T9SS type A sorting domain-containing protein [Pontimicrobium aquaticum]